MAEIHHIVLMKIPPSTSPQEIAAAFDAHRDLVGRLDGLLGVEGGPNLSEEVYASGFTHGVLFRFSDAAARDRYLTDDRHLAAAVLMQKVMTEWVVCDYEV